MLEDAIVAATLPVDDRKAAKDFYEQKLGLKVSEEDEGGITYGRGPSKVYVYESQYAGTNQATAASWEVEDLDGTVELLRQKGVTFERYDLPGTTREGDIHTMGSLKGVWFKDPSGNILSIVQRI